MYDTLLSEDTSTPDKGLIKDSLRKEIERALNKLTTREADILKLNFGLNGKSTHTLEEISEELNLSKERIRQIKIKSIKRLQHTMLCGVLKTYLG
jgi:RNA polymerase primary sigma factor